LKDDYKTSVPKAELQDSKDTRERLLAKWGFEPLSMMWMNKIHERTLDVLVEDTLAQGSYETHNYNIRDGALAQTPTILVERLIKFYTEPGDTILNPMCERAPHLLIANYLKRHAIGQDICEKFIRHDVEKVKKRILAAQSLNPDDNKILVETENLFISAYNGLQFALIKGDSRHIDLPNNSIDFIITSPPYWNLGIYGDEPEQAGSGTMAGKGDTPTFVEFLAAMKDIYAECYRVLKPGKYMAVQVNDFRKGGKFYNYHCATINTLEDVGFNLHDIIIYNTSLHPLAAIFTSQLAERRIFAKNHEYNITVRKD
jgi:DNA modification methylase